MDIKLPTPRGQLSLSSLVADKQKEVEDDTVLSMQDVWPELIELDEITDGKHTGEMGERQAHLLNNLDAVMIGQVPLKFIEDHELRLERQRLQAVQEDLQRQRQRAQRLAEREERTRLAVMAQQDLSRVGMCCRIELSCLIGRSCVCAVAGLRHRDSTLR